jgi:uracil-DNA glycosylase family 4
MIRDPECTRCPMHQEAQGEDRCVIGSIPRRGTRLLVVTKFPTAREQIAHLLKSSGIEEPFALTSAIKCRTWTLDPSKTDVKTCRHFLHQELEVIDPEWVLTLGNEALFAVTGHSGIMKHRGKVYPVKDHRAKVMGTLSPAHVKISPGYEKGFRGDLRLFNALLAGRADKLHAKVPFRRAMTPEDLPLLNNDLYKAHGVAIDIESNAFEEYKPDSRMISIAFTIWAKNSTDPVKVWAVPLYHPESPFKDKWQTVLHYIWRALKDVPVRVGHNGKFDGRWLAQFNAPIIFTFDTLLGAHLLDENRSKSLESLSREELTIPTWKIPTNDLLNKPLAEVLKYNAQDTLNTARLYFVERAELKRHPNLARLFMLLLMPASDQFIHIERRGVWVDREKLHENWAVARANLKRITEELMSYIPQNHPFDVKFNASHFLRWWLFEYLELPVLKKSQKTGMPSLAEEVLLQLVDDHPVIKLLLERTKWARYDRAFFGAYDELMDENDRLHTTFRLHGTVTGRLSSGKADAEKVQAKIERGVNLQQVPRDRFVRGVIGSPLGRMLVSADYSQVEFRLGAMLAHAESVVQLYDSGQDVHLVMAQRLTGKEASEIQKEERKRAKWVNFGFLYGMGWATFIDTVWRGYQVRVSEKEAKIARRTFFETFPEFLIWHEEQREFARRHGYVTSLLGRTRHLPNIRSSSKTVRAEAERQAINSPVQSLASDMTLLSTLLVNERFRAKSVDGYVIGTVHDEALYEIANQDLPRALPIIHSTMQNLPLQRMFGVKLTVPIVANVKCSRHWDTDDRGGELKELSEEEIYDYQMAS